jgi:hypothetical protein
MHKQLCVLATVLAAGLPAAHAQLILDGNIDGLAPGSAPDCGVPAGAWHFVIANCEIAPSEIRIVRSADFDPLASPLDNSIAQQAVGGQMFIENLLTAPVVENPGHILIVEFDLWVAAEGTAGGNMYLYDQSTNSRAVQIGWQADGTLSVPALPSDPPPACPVAVVSYPPGAWQHVRLVLNVGARDFDLWWSLRGGTPVRYLDRRPFRHASAAGVTSFVYGRFASNGCITIGECSSYLDNVSAWETWDLNGNRIPDDEECYANCDQSTAAPILNVLDFSCFLNQFAAGDTTANCDGSTAEPVLNVLDFSCFLNQFAAGCR